MDEISLTIDIGGSFYIGPISKWRNYARTLSAGKQTCYRRGPLYRNQSLTGFFDHFRRTWKADRPEPVSFGLINLQPSNFDQSAIIDELIAA